MHTLGQALTKLEYIGIEDFRIHVEGQQFTPVGRDMAIGTATNARPIWPGETMPTGRS